MNMKKNLIWILASLICVTTAAHASDAYKGQSDFKALLASTNERGRFVAGQTLAQLFEDAKCNTNMPYFLSRRFYAGAALQYKYDGGFLGLVKGPFESPMNENYSDAKMQEAATRFAKVESNACVRVELMEMDEEKAEAAAYHPEPWAVTDAAQRPILSESDSHLSDKVDGIFSSEAK
jgi:hypothetical protein